MRMFVYEFRQKWVSIDMMARIFTYFYFLNPAVLNLHHQTSLHCVLVVLIYAGDVRDDALI